MNNNIFDYDKNISYHVMCIFCISPFQQDYILFWYTLVMNIVREQFEFQMTSEYTHINERL